MRKGTSTAVRDRGRRFRLCGGIHQESHKIMRARASGFGRTVTECRRATFHSLCKVGVGAVGAYATESG